MANRAIRSPVHRADPRGLQWGADVVPALMGLFRVEKDTRDDRPDGWVGFAAVPEGYRPATVRHWRGGVLRLDFDLSAGHEGRHPILVVTAVLGREGQTTSRTVVDEDFGEVELPDRVPSRREWQERRRRYEAARRADAADGSAAVKAYIAALPGWKRDVAARIDAIIEREVPGVRRAVKWHSPFYGVEGEGWFASFGVFSKYVKLTFLRGASLEPAPPREHPEEARALDVRETDALDEAQVASWVRQATALPG